MPAEKVESAPLATKTSADGATWASRTILPAPKTGWNQVAMGEWELRAQEVGDCHPHDEVNYVLEGRLVVECDGETVDAGPGDVIRVPADHPAYYRASDYARMIFVYGPNPDARPTDILASRE